VIAPYTVDFCCVALKLIVEVDGEHHFTNEGMTRDRDRVRDRYLTELGYQVLRIPGYQVVQ
jgi:very-short-patch-repair endonuclease